MGNKRLIWIDVAKGLAILLVIMGHSLDNLSFVRRIIFSFHMPLFFITAGYTFREKPRFEQLRTSAHRLLIPYTLLFMATTVVNVTVFNGGNELSSLASRLLAYFWAAGWIWRGIQNVGAIWFFVALFGARIVLNELLGLFREKDVSIPTQGVVMCVLACFGYLIGSVADIWLPFDMDIFPIAALFMWLGLQLREKNLLNMLCKPAVISAIAVTWLLAIRFSTLEIATRGYTLFPLAIVGAIAGSLLVFAFSRWLEHLSDNPIASKSIDALSFIGQRSMKLFCIHYLDYYIEWGAIAISILGFHNITAGIIRIVFDVLLLVLFERFV